MAASAFSNKSVMPTRHDLDELLSECAALLQDIEAFLLDHCSGWTPEWKFYGKRAGWTVSYGFKGRRIFHLIPQAGHFTMVFVLGKRAVSACRESRLPEAIKSTIESAREYVEGRSVRVDVRTRKDVTAAKQLVAIKLAN
jgi:Protein of unknown function (DUF3788)